MLTKTKLKEQLAHFPEEFTLEELIDNLIFIEKIQVGLDQTENGEVKSTEKLETQMKGWFV